MKYALLIKRKAGKYEISVFLKDLGRVGDGFLNGVGEYGLYGLEPKIFNFISKKNQQTTFKRILLKVFLFSV